jgi:L-histidine Nalpha-methyltransferase
MSACADAAVPSSPDAEDVRRGLLREISEGLSRAEKQLPSKLFYDERGSQLFDQITGLPEYYLTRAERSLLRRHMPSWIGRFRPRSLVEFGAGSAEKTRTILDAMQSAGGTHYVPVDISVEYLHQAGAQLRRDFPWLNVLPCPGDFTTEIGLPADLPRPALFTILGSTIGNFAPAEASALVQRIAAVMDAGDVLLLGVDLRKSVAVLEAAYDDSAGVTAEFNLNLLRVINREFGANFDLGAYRHRVTYDRRLHRMEMHLVADTEQDVQIPGAGAFRIAPGETIRTEISCKYNRRAVREILGPAGMTMTDWFDDGRFALVTASPSAAAESAR